METIRAVVSEVSTARSMITPMEIGTAVSVSWCRQTRTVPMRGERAAVTDEDTSQNRSTAVIATIRLVRVDGHTRGGSNSWNSKHRWKR